MGFEFLTSAEIEIMFHEMVRKIKKVLPFHDNNFNKYEHRAVKLCHNFNTLLGYDVLEIYGKKIIFCLDQYDIISYDLETDRFDFKIKGPATCRKIFNCTDKQLQKLSRGQIIKKLFETADYYYTNFYNSVRSNSALRWSPNHEPTYTEFFYRNQHQ